ncbi:MAG TPA: hypothetical protein VGC79_08155 [Polyangiaceae bacterium]
MLGLILSCVLLSMGAPFWYNALAGLLKLRNTLQTKNESADAEKSAQPAAPSPASPQPIAPPAPQGVP